MNIQNTQVVVGFDFSAGGQEALRRALLLAARSGTHVLHFLRVLEHGTYQEAEAAQTAVADAVTKELAGIEGADQIHFFVHARIGRPVDQILGLAREVGADLIIVGTHGHTGLERLLLGSVAERVVREASCTVEVARPTNHTHVELLDVKPVESHHTYVKPHRYFYESSRVQFRPTDWPLY